MMSLLTPVFLLLGLLVLPIILMYMLRLRRREMLVSSTMLWQRFFQDREANAPWQRLRRNLLLLLQLLILAALVIALARPFVTVPSVVSGNVVVVLDGSASMLATDVSPDRMAIAKDRVSHLIGELGSGDQMTLILAGLDPAVLVSASTDRSFLRQKLAKAEASPVEADWPAAFALASGAAQGYREAKIVIVSDGGLPHGLPPLPAETIFLPIGESGENLAISALATRDSDMGVQLFAAADNYGHSDHQALVSLYLDGQLFDSRRVSIPAGEKATLTWDLPQDVSVIMARLSEHEGDTFAVDDAAWAVHQVGATSRALLFSEGNRFLETALAVLPGVEVFKAETGETVNGPGDPGFDLFIFDGVPLPDPLPQADMLIIDPLGDMAAGTAGKSPILTVSGVFSGTNVVRLVDGPLLQYVDWSKVRVRQAKQIETSWAQPLVIAEGGPLLLAGQQQGQRVVILPFRLQESDLPLQIAFPVLMANITTWLNPGLALDGARQVLPGDPIALSPRVGATAVVIQGPGEVSWLEEIGDETVIFTETDQLGLYEVWLRDVDGDQEAGKFAVNLFSPEESRMEPATTITFGQMVLNSKGQEHVGQRELWPWLAVVALAVLAAEWWIYHRGTRFLWTVIALLLFLSACDAGQGQVKPLDPTPTVSGAFSSQPELVSFTQLQADPHAYRDRLVRVSGAYFPLPLPACMPFSGPLLRWALVADELRLDARGFEQLSGLVSENAIFTIDGYFRLYDGPVGCGKGAPVGSVWFLEVVQIVQPNPLARVLRTPGSGDSQPGTGLSNTPQLPPGGLTTPLPTAAFGTPISTAGPFTPSPPATGASGTLTATPLLTTIPTGTPTSLPTSSPTAISTATPLTPVPTINRPTATGTPNPLATFPPAPTATQGTLPATPTQTATLEGYPALPTEPVVTSVYP